MPLPSRKEECEFTLRPVSQTVKNLISDVQDEDGGIDRVAIHSMTGRKISSSTPIEILVQQDFKIHINDESYDIIPSKGGKKINLLPVTVKQISVSNLSLTSLVLLNIFKKTSKPYLSNKKIVTISEQLQLSLSFFKWKIKKIDLFQNCFCKFLWAELVIFELLLMIRFTQNMKTKQLKKIKHENTKDSTFITDICWYLRLGRI